MKDMTHEQLIRATYVVAKYENPKTAQLLTELAGRLDCALVAARTACLERDSAVRAEVEWETAMRQAVGEDGVDDVVLAIEKLKAGLDVQSARSDALAAKLNDVCAENAALREHRPQPSGAAMMEALDAFYEYHEDVPEQGMMAAFEILCCKRPETPNTDAWVNEQRAAGRVEGVNFAAARLAAAFNHGFIDKPTAEVYDVVKAVLGAKEDLATAPDDGLSGEYAEQALNDWAAQLRGSQV
ncbi:hypothetical protein FHC77_19295 [Atlantibacter hermannii]|uniref:hypothetical protein n=1 Tax=Atlantibacter hermannii TaxID=565 RepID=UPI001C702362|nr:hypothetical protein [Atlantibacter hermannii]MBW9432857.1 hypothetical protein [Atlantibacter hermannii]